MTKNDLKKLIKECIEEIGHGAYVPYKPTGNMPSTDPDRADKAAYRRFHFKVGDKVTFYHDAYRKDFKGVITDVNMDRWSAIVKTSSGKISMGFADLRPIKESLMEELSNSPLNGAVVKIYKGGAPAGQIPIELEKDGKVATILVPQHLVQRAEMDMSA